MNEKSSLLNILQKRISQSEAHERKRFDRLDISFPPFPASIPTSVVVA